MLTAKYTVQHSPYTGSTDSDGYPTGDAFGAAVSRPAFGWYALSSVLNPTGDYATARRREKAKAKKWLAAEKAWKSSPDKWID
jgi:hypothetical protein